MKEKLAAIILAAGYSSRMGEFKPLLPLSGKSFVERGIDLFRSTADLEVSVVTGYRNEILNPVVEQAGAKAVFNRNYQEGMFSSVVTGIEQLDADVDAFFVLPVDIPLIKRTTIRQMVEKWHRNRDCIIHPVFMGKRGHPPLIPIKYTRKITQQSGEGGLRSVLSKYENKTIQLEVDDPNIIHDADTPEDYKLLLYKEKRFRIPTRREAEAILLGKQGKNTRVYHHSKAVASLSVNIAKALTNTGVCLDHELIFASGMLHDMAKGESDHALAAGRALKKMGYESTARVVEKHIDLGVGFGGQINETSLVYLADKLLKGDKTVQLEERYRPGMERFKKEKSIMRSISRRLNDAKLILKGVERIAGINIDHILKQWETEYQSIRH